jgi:hypothetical protein
MMRRGSFVTSDPGENEPPYSNRGVERAINRSEGVRVLWAGIDTVNFTIPGDETRDLCDRALAALPPEDNEVVTAWNDDVVIVRRGGVAAYQASIWRGDVRAYVARRKSQGIWLQVGSATCMKGPEAVQDAAYSFCQEILGFSALDRACDLTRLDIACDVAAPLPGLDEWMDGWVGRSTFSPETNGKLAPVEEAEEEEAHFRVYQRRKSGRRGWNLETIYMGSGKSAVQLRAYNKLLKYDAADLAAWKLTEDELPEAITRFEWQVRVKDRGFALDLADLNASLVAGLASKLLAWGRLTVPSETDSDARRWALHPVFQAVIDALSNLRDETVNCPSLAPGPISRPLTAALEWSVNMLTSVAAKMLEGGREPESLDETDMLIAFEKVLKMRSENPRVKLAYKYQKRMVLTP